MFFRFLYKLVSNIVGIGVGAITVLFVPRSLGVADYGNFNFLNTTLTSFINIVDSGSSKCFFTRLSKEEDVAAEIQFYLIYSVFILFILSATLLIVGFPHSREVLFPDISLNLILLGSILAFQGWMSTQFSQIFDALRFTKSSVIVFMLKRVLLVAMIVAAFYLGRLDIYTLFYVNILLSIVEHLLFIVLLSMYRPDAFHKKITKQYFIEKLRIYFDFIKPLFISSFLSFVMIYGERWILQHYSGPEAQGYYSLAQRMTILVTSILTAMTPIFTVEFSKKISSSEAAAKLYLQINVVLTLIALAISCFLSFFANEAVLLVGDKEYLAAAHVVAILLFYPVTQVWGQISGTVLYVLGKTKLSALIGVITLGSGILLMVVLIVPGIFSPTGLGATGLAIKYIVSGGIGAWLAMFLSYRLMKIRLWPTMLRFGVAAAGFYAFLRLIYSHIPSDNTLVYLLINLFLYICFCTVFCYFISGKEVRHYLNTRMTKLARWSRAW